MSRSDSTGLTVATARTEAERIKNEVKHNGADPVADRRKRAVDRGIEKATTVDVRMLFEKWAKTDLINRKDKGAEARHMMEKDVLPFIGSLNVKDVSKRDILAIVDRLTERGVNRMAKVVFSLIQPWHIPIVEDIHQNGKISAMEAEKLWKVTRRTATTRLKKMCQEGLLVELSTGSFDPYKTFILAKPGNQPRRT